MVVFLEKAVNEGCIYEVPVERAKVHDEMQKVRVENFEVLDWNEKVPDGEFVSASLLGGASRDKPSQLCWLSSRSSTPKAQLS